MAIVTTEAGVAVDTAELRKLAERADDGRTWQCDATSVFVDGSSGWRDGGESVFEDEHSNAVDREHIAAFDPPTALAILDRIDELEAAARLRSHPRVPPA